MSDKGNRVRDTISTLLNLTPAMTPTVESAVRRLMSAALDLLDDDRAADNADKEELGPQAAIGLALAASTFDGDPDEQGLDPFALQHHLAGRALLEQALAQFKLADLHQARAIAGTR